MGKDKTVVVYVRNSEKQIDMNECSRRDEISSSYVANKVNLSNFVKRINSVQYKFHNVDVKKIFA